MSYFFLTLLYLISIPLSADPVPQNNINTTIQEEEKSDSTTSGLESKSEEIDDKIDFSAKTKEIIEDSKTKLQKELNSATTKNEKEFREALLALENYRSKLSEISLLWFEDLKKIIKNYKVISKNIDSIEKSFNHIAQTSNEDLILLFSKINSQWQTLIDDGFTVYKMTMDQSVLDDLPKIPVSLLRNLTAPERKRYESAYKVSETERNEVLSAQKDKVKDNFNDFYRLLARSSRIRSEALSELNNRDVSVLHINPSFFSDMAKEIFVIPFRISGILYQRYLEVQSNLSKGLIGLWNIAKNISALLFLFFIPLISRYVSRILRNYLDKYRANLIKRGRVISKRNLFQAFLIQRLTPYTPWILYSLILAYANSILTGTVLEEFGIIIPIAQYIIVYKIFRLLVSDTLSSLKNIARLNRTDTQELINSTSKFVGYFFLFSYTTLHLTKITAHEGLLYRQVSTLIEVLGIFICTYAAYRWRNYLAPAAETLLSSNIGKFLSKKCLSKWSLLFCLPTLVLIITKVATNAIWDWASELEFSKKFLAKLYRKKVESLSAETNHKDNNGILPEAYSKLFTNNQTLDSSLYVDSNAKAIDTLKKEIDAWNTNTEEDQSAVIYGEKGIGKSTLLNLLAQNYKNINVIQLKIPPKTYQREALNSFISQSLGIENSESLTKNILNFNNKLEKNTLILIDDAQNLFLGQYNGFEALNSYIDIVNLRADKIFWCTAFNECSWAYVKGVLGSFQYLRTEVHLKEWSDESIKNLILQRHNKTEFNLSYDQIILASQSALNRSNAIIHAEEQFFRILWEQSNGNPRVALFLWENCLSLKGHSTLKVSLPEYPVTEMLSMFDENLWFVLAALAKHENLTRNETCTVTNLSWAQVAHAIKLGLENKIIYKGEGNRFRLHFTHLHGIMKQLKVKNFVYGID